MTRDEAIKIQRRHTPTNVVDILADLGVLKLDEPPTLDGQINIAINTYLFTAANKCAGGVKSALDRAGLKIVEK